jgi:hypothetical protein
MVRRMLEQSGRAQSNGWASPQKASSFSRE